MIKKILIIEDEEALSNMYKVAFELSDFEVVIANNGLTGLMKMMKFLPDLILLDIMMPKLNGFEFLAKLRKINQKKTFQIIVNSNLEQKDDEQTARSLGADFYIRKSLYTAREIVDKVKEFNRINQWS